MKLIGLSIFILIIVIGAIAMFISHIRVNLDSAKTALPSIEDVPREYWKKLARKKIFFGHKSVGHNIVDGIKDLTEKYDYIKLNIVETRNPAEFNKPVFGHNEIGRNTYPSSKINDFKDVMDAGIASKADIVFFKFCYIDIRRDSDPKRIFGEYSSVMSELENRYSKTKFIHVTAPVSSAPKGIKKSSKSFIKSLIGKKGAVDDNIKRQEYNSLLNTAYGNSKKKYLFDLALAESVNPDGFRRYMKKNGQKVYVLDDGYTDDGGHLNEEGRKRVAEQLLIVLAKLSNSL